MTLQDHRRGHCIVLGVCEEPLLADSAGSKREVRIFLRSARESVAREIIT
jgi:hypothetical protein